MNAVAKIEVEQLPVGIHFNVPDEVYFAQTALGSTDIKALAIDPVEWQFKRLHGEEKVTAEKIWGSGLHARTLEGAEAFNQRFQAEPIKPKQALDTKDDLAGWLTDHEVSFRKAAAKPELIALVKANDPKALIWDEVVSRFRDTVPEDQRVSVETIAEINLAAEWMQADPMIAPIMEGGTFKFGSPELTIIYETRGVMRRARLDYLIPGRIIDLKSYRPWRNGNPVIGITQAIGNFRHDLQAADYLKAFSQGSALYRAGKVFGVEPYDGFLDKTFGAGDLPKWVWVFVKGEGAPQPRVVEFPQALTVFKIAETQIDIAVENYRTNVEQYGLANDWRPIPGAIHLADEDFPAWFGRN